MAWLISKIRVVWLLYVMAVLLFAAAAWPDMGLVFAILGVGAFFGAVIHVIAKDMRRY